MTSCTPTSKVVVAEVFSCDDHVRGHRSEEAAVACRQRRERRRLRQEKREQDRERRLANQRDEPEQQFVRRRYCRDGDDPARVAKALNTDYPKREEGPWTWVDVITIHAEHLNWPTDDELKAWLEKHPKVLLPSELRKKAGVSQEMQMEGK